MIGVYGLLCWPFYSLLGVSCQSIYTLFPTQPNLFLLPFGSFLYIRNGYSKNFLSVLSTPFWEFPHENCAYMSATLYSIFLLPFGSFGITTHSTYCRFTLVDSLSTPFWEFRAQPLWVLGSEVTAPAAFLLPFGSFVWLRSSIHLYLLNIVNLSTPFWEFQTSPTLTT